MSTKRIIIAVLASIVCGWGIWQTTRVGLARTLEEYAARGRRDNVATSIQTIARVTDPQAAADRAVALLPQDAEAYSAQGDVFQSVSDYQRARDAYARAV